MTNTLAEAIATYGTPEAITCGKGTEFTENHFDAWAHNRGIKVDFIAPGKPTQDTFIESFNGSFRDESLNTSWFETPADARRRIEEWRHDYHRAKTALSIGVVTPTEYAAQLLA